MQQISNMVLLHHSPKLDVYYSSIKDCYLLSKLKCAMKYAIFFSKGTFQVWCGVETFIMPTGFHLGGGSSISSCSISSLCYFMNHVFSLTKINTPLHS